MFGLSVASFWKWQMENLLIRNTLLLKVTFNLFKFFLAKSDHNLFDQKGILLTATKGSPKLNKPQKWSAEFVQFVNSCLLVNPRARATVDQLLEVCFD